MNKKLTFPMNKKFAFTIIDDTDYGYIKNTKPVYDLLKDLDMRTTKTAWVFHTRDGIDGGCVEDEDYRDWLLQLQKDGFEIASHGIGSGKFNREETLKGYEIFKNVFGNYPVMHINHSENYSNIYWGSERFTPVVKSIYKNFGSKTKSFGHDEKSEYFWGDFCKKNIKYIRNRCFNEINTIKCDSRMPYQIDSMSKYSNYWFSASDGCSWSDFSKLLSKQNVDRLEKNGGISIVYAHFGMGFVKNGKVRAEVEECLSYIASKNGWFVPASHILDFLNEKNKTPSLSKNSPYLFSLDLKWMKEKIMQKIKGKE